MSGDDAHFYFFSTLNVSLKKMGIAENHLIRSKHVLLDNNSHSTQNDSNSI